MGQPQRPCTDGGQDAHDERRDAKAACKGPADRRQRNADRLAAVFPFALQTALPCGEAVGLRPAHGIARLCKGVCNAAQHRRADFAARLNGAVQHIAEVVVIVLIFGSFVVRHLVVQSVVSACRGRRCPALGFAVIGRFPVGCGPGMSGPCGRISPPSVPNSSSARRRSAHRRRRRS